MRSNYVQAKIAQHKRAMSIKRSLGVRIAAGYLRNQGWSVEAAAYVLGRI